jgi:hypothetical protein
MTQSTSIGAQGPKTLAYKLLGPGTYINRMLAAMPTDEATKQRFAGQVLASIGEGSLRPASGVMGA